MPETSEIPRRALFRAVEVCELAQVQPYVLRSWESEFPSLGLAKSAGGPRVYRRADVEQVLRIKQLVFGDGLTLAGARRRLEEEAAPPAENLPLEELLGRHARERLAEVKRGLRSILELLSSGKRSRSAADYRLTPPSSNVRRMPVARGPKGAPAVSRTTKTGNAKSARKRRASA